MQNSPEVDPVESSLTSRREVADRVQVGCLELFSQQAAPATFISLAVAAVTASVLWSVTDHAAVLLWIGAMTAYAAVRYWMIGRFRRETMHGDLAARWRARFEFLSFGGGLLWGIAGSVLLPAESTAHQVFLGFVFGGVTAGAVGYLSPLWRAYLFYIWPIAVLYISRLMFVDGYMAQAMAVMSMLFAILMSLVSRRMSEMVEESLRLRFYREELTQSLSETNRQLTEEVRERTRAESEARENELRAKVLADAPYEGVVVHEKGIIVDANQTILDMLRLTYQQAIGRRLVDFVPPEYRMLIAEEVAKATGQPIETLALRSDGSTLPVEVRGRDLPYHGRLARVVSLRDISEARAARAKIHRLSNYDPLTGLANRDLLREQLRIAISAAQRRHCFVGALCINLDNFKAINTLLGNEAGDQLLQFVAGRIKLATRSGDTIGRTAGDEFGVVLDGLNGTEDAVLIAQRAIQAMEERFEIDGQEVFTSVSIGIAIHPLDGDDADSLLRNAMSAMQRAKEKGGNSYEFFTAEINKQAARRFEIETHLRRAIERGEFVLHYQPKVSLRTGQLVGAEALIRWQHPTRGVISPLEFIPLAEKSGLIVPIGEWVLQCACADMRRWEEMGLLEFPVSINLSLRQLRERDLSQSIAMALDAHGLPPSALELELTESSLADNIDLTASQLRELDALGIVISIDDFGTGYSSLSYLRQYPVRTLKVDRSFVRNLPDEPGDAAIARSVVALAGGLGIKSVAEGVETVDQLTFLIDTGYDAVQGYLICKPLAAQDFIGWLKLWLQSAASVDNLAMHPLLPRFGQLGSHEKGERL